MYLQLKLVECNNNYYVRGVHTPSNDYYDIDIDNLDLDKIISMLRKYSKINLSLDIILEVDEEMTGYKSYRFINKHKNHKNKVIRYISDFNYIHIKSPTGYTIYSKNQFKGAL